MNPMRQIVRIVWNAWHGWRWRADCARFRPFYD